MPRFPLALFATGAADDELLAGSSVAFRFFVFAFTVRRTIAAKGPLPSSSSTFSAKLVRGIESSRAECLSMSNSDGGG